MDEQTNRLRASKAHVGPPVIHGQMDRRKDVTDEQTDGRADAGRQAGTHARASMWEEARGQLKDAQTKRPDRRADGQTDGRADAGRQARTHVRRGEHVGGG